MINGKNFLKILIFIFVSANIVVWGGRFLKRGTTGKNGLKNQYSGNFSFVDKRIGLPYFRAEYTDGLPFSSDTLNSRLNVLIFFTFEDCSSCLYEAVYWGEAARLFNFPLVSFFGITSDIDTEKINAFVREYKIPFPIIFDQNGKIKEKILSIYEPLRGRLITPFKVFLNKNREIIHIEGPKKENDGKPLFLDLVIRLNKDMK